MSDVRKKLYIIAGLVIISLLVFVLSEENIEYGSEIELWKLNFSELQFKPAADSWNGKDKDKFIRSEIKIKRNGSLLSRYFFSVEFNDAETGQQVYEGGYNSRNLFTELAVPKTRNLLSHDASLMGRLGIEPGKSPVIHLVSGSDSKSLILGNKNRDNSSRFFLVENKGIYALHSYIFDRFAADPVTLRERQIISVTDKFVRKVEYKNSSGTTLIITNQPETANNQQISNWLKNKTAFSRQKSGQIDSDLRLLRADVFPDEKDGQGFAVAKVLTGFDVESTLKIEIADGSVLEVSLYPPTDIKNVHYIPFRRKVNNQFTESPAYMRKDSFERFLKVYEEEKAIPPVKNN